MIKSTKDKLKKYHIEFRHITAVVLMLVVFQFILSLVQRSSFNDLLTETQHWYQRHSAEILGNTNATSLELLIENVDSFENLGETQRRKIIQSFNIILTQQILERNIKEICIVTEQSGSIITIDNGIDLLHFLENKQLSSARNSQHKTAVSLYKKKYETIKKNEEILTSIEKQNEFDILVPLAPRGELIGLFYICSNPDFSSISSEILSNYNQVAIIYLSIILLGLLTMYYITTYTMRERDRVQQKLFEEQQQNLKRQIEHEKESLFTKRIYHTHHKAEKVMGFIKDDLRELSTENTELIKDKVTKYANFVARAIYDMKWYDPPINTIRNPIFKTNVNQLIRFIVNNIFLRVSSKMEKFKFTLVLDEKFPLVGINEFVVWEIIEPLIQNSIDHAPERNIEIIISTKYLPEEKISQLIIEDNGDGIPQNLIESNEEKIQKIFLENVSTKNLTQRNSGYGCYIAHQLATKKCGWDLTAQNMEIGCKFIFTLKV